MLSAQVKSATRAIEILELFKRVRHPRSMSEIAAALGYPASSTTVLLKTLVKLGYLNYDRHERLYFPTPKVTSLGEWIPRALFGSSRVLEAMRDLQSATGEGISVCTKNDIYLQYVQVIYSTHAVRFDIDEGALRLLPHSAVGWTLMSTLPDERIDNLIRRANIAAEKTSERVSIPDIMARIRVIREQGYAWTENIPFLGGATLCMLLPITIQNQPVVLTLGGASERMRANRDRYLEALRRAVKSVTPENPFDQPIDIEF